MRTHTLLAPKIALLAITLLTAGFPAASSLTANPTMPGEATQGPGDDTTRSASGEAGPSPAETSARHSTDAEMDRLSREDGKVNLRDAMLDIADQADAQDFSLRTAVDHAKQATKLQAQDMDLPWRSHEFSPMHETPSEAILTLLERHDIEPTAKQLTDVHHLDEQPTTVAEALRTVVDAFIGLEIATQQALATIEERHLTAHDPGPATGTHALLPSRAANPVADLPTDGEAIDWIPVLAQRNHLLAAIVDLRTALDETAGEHAASEGNHTDVNVPPAIIVSLNETANNTYTNDTALLIDAGGNDTYHNNAGGARFGEPTQTAALIDLDEGDDVFGNPEDLRSRAVNGGAQSGVGFLLAEAGNNTYTAGNESSSLGGGTNGGMDTLGTGFLLEAGNGNTTYNSSRPGSNGGGDGGGMGFLLDRGGNDTYLSRDEGDASIHGVNGGASGLFWVGTGLLLDEAGDDQYIVEDLGKGTTNGAGGALVDANGTDTYRDGHVFECEDCSVAPKEHEFHVGIQLDSDEVPASGAPLENTNTDRLSDGETTDCSDPGADDKCEAWVADTGCGICSIVVGPDSERMYTGAPSALNAETGEVLWEAEYPGDWSLDDDIWLYSPGGLAVSPDGERLIVVRTTATGASSAGENFYHTTAWNTSTGDLVWTAPHDMRGTPKDAAVGPNGERVYVTGQGGTVAYDLETGENEWSTDAGTGGALWSGGGFNVLAGPDGESVYVASESGTSEEGHEATALDASTGQIQWTAQTPNPMSTQLYGADLSADGQTLVLAGGWPLGYVAAFDTDQGKPLWDADLDTAQTTSESIFAAAIAVAFGPDGQNVYVQASGEITSGDNAYIVAYDARSGEEEWTSMQPGDYASPGLEGLAVHPDGSHVYTTLDDATTVAVDATTGEKVWIGVFDDASDGRANGNAIAPDGSHVYSHFVQDNVAYKTGGAHAEASESKDKPLGPPVPSAAQPKIHQANQALADGLMEAIDTPDRPARASMFEAAHVALDQRQVLADDAALEASFDRQRANLDLSEAIIELSEVPDRSSVERSLDIAEVGLQDRRTMATQGELDEANEGPLAQATANLDTVRTLMATLSPDQRGELSEAIQLAKEASGHQAASTGLAWNEPANAHAHGSPSEAVLELADRFDAEPTSAELDQIESMDALPKPTRTALTDLLDAFLAFDDAVTQAYTNADLQTLAELPSQGELLHDALDAPPAILNPTSGPLEGEGEGPTPMVDPEPPKDPLAKLAEAGVDLSQVLPTRDILLDAALALQQSLEDNGQSMASLPDVRIAPALAINLTTADSTYTEDYALLVDAGGDDRYANNAGGSGLLDDHTGDCRLSTDDPAATRPDAPAAALFDLGTGDDDYTSPERGCGVRGGGYLGAGLLVDEGGNDTFAPYSPEHQGPETAPATDETPGRSSPDARGIDNDSSSDEAEETTSARFIVGLHREPQRSAGDTFHGQTIVDTSHALRFLVVQPDDSDAFLEDARTDPDVRYVEEDQQIQLDHVPNDPLFADQYGPEQINADQAWDTSLGDASRSVCVVDSGVDLSHPDLAEDRYQGGYDFVNDDADPYDDNGHGTHVTGIAAATIDNAEGIAGTGNVGFQAVKAYSSTGTGYFSDVAQGIVWCADNGGDVISMSFSHGESSTVEYAINYASEAGSMLVTSAGNNGCFDCISYPGLYDEVVTVTCTDRQAELCSFSSYGPDAELAAPGEQILSTAAGIMGGGYENRSGTSMSTPYVSGVAALVWTQASDLTAGELRQLLRDNALEVGPPGCDEKYGHGIVDAAASLQSALDGDLRGFEGAIECVSGGNFGTNGGGFGGLGLLIAAGQGDNTFGAGGFGTNGGGTQGLGVLVNAGDGADAYWGGATGVNGGGGAGIGFLLDAGGNDSYTATSHGTNGGGDGGVGFLLDADGDDRYTAGSRGTNGGGNSYARGVGLLFDADGDDRYRADSYGANGGGYGGTGMLLDPRGSDAYHAEGHGTNGGAYFNGAGFLVETDGSDSYQATTSGTNGGGFNTAAGFLVDTDADDSYRATNGATNGGGVGEGTGFLLDSNGSNAYEATFGGTNGGGATSVLDTHGTGFLLDAGESDSTYKATDRGTNGGVVNGQIGFLLDVGGDDAYQATHWGTNGGNARGHGFLLDGGGDDTYNATWGGTNGGAHLENTGLLFDAEGNDAYTATKWGTNGGGWQAGAAGFLLDAAGDDTYDATSHATNGGGAGGIGFLADYRGDDAYTATDYAVNGGGFFGNPSGVGTTGPTDALGTLYDRQGNDTYIAGSCGANGGGAMSDCLLADDERAAHGPGLLLDGAGTDDYLDALVDCRDCSKLPKGASPAAQVDSEFNAGLLGLR